MTHITLAAMIGGWELILILMALLLPVVIGGVVLAIYLLTRFWKSKSPSIPPKIPSATVRLHKCPKCGSPLNVDAPEGLCPACLLQHGFATEGGASAGQTAFVPPTISELARLFPQLEIISLIGKGGMGAVYKARQPALDRMVALKILAPQPGTELDFASRFAREAKALARLNHPNIVGVYDFGVVTTLSESGHRTDATSSESAHISNAALSYFLMEFVDGPNLRQVEQAGKLSPREALEIIPQICAALQFAHDEGIVHRDIKPENVLLDKKGRVKIADFGLAKILGQEAKDFRLTGAKDVMGTPHYMAPEQVETPQEVDHRADIFSLGVVFYEMLTGELPLGKFAPPSQKVQVDVRLDEIVLRALEKEPGLRYQQASEFKTRVETVASGGGASSYQASVNDRPESRNDFNPAHFVRGLKTAAITFLLILSATVLINFLLPETYVGTARIMIDSAGSKKFSEGPKTSVDFFLVNEIQRMKSPEVLEHVASSLNLQNRQKSEVETKKAGINLLSRAIQIKDLHPAGVVQVQAYSGSPKEAAEIANQIVKSYRMLSPDVRALIIDSALPDENPIKPNRPLNIFLGAGGGLLLGGILGLLTGLFSFWKDSHAKNSTLGKTGRFWGWVALATALVLIMLVSLPVIAFVTNSTKARTHAQKLAVPLMQTNSSVAVPTEAEEEGSNEKSVPAPQPVLLSSGDVTLELVAIGSLSDSNQLWWLPDGRPKTNVFDSTFHPPMLPTRTIRLPGAANWNSKATHSYTFVFRSKEKPTLPPRLEIGEQTVPLMIQPIFHPPDFRTAASSAVENVYCGNIELPEDQQTADCTLSFSTGPWMIDESIPNFRSGNLTGIKITSGGLNWTVTTRLEETNGAVRLTGSHPLFWSAGWDQQLVLLAGDGAAYNYSTNESVLNNGSITRMEVDQTYKNLSLDDVRDVRFRIRPYQQFSVRNISLQSGRSTMVEVTNTTRWETVPEDFKVEPLSIAELETNPAQTVSTSVQSRVEATNSITSATTGLVRHEEKSWSRAELSARLEAAKGIFGFSQKDSAMAAVARDAAAAGEAEIVKQALGQITGFSNRDDAARIAARRLAQNGHRTEALEIARTITAFSTRDATLRELADK
ncbi:MAG TPA: protein kinase [Verrucomicrobiae bacterium]|nr:protein kinase [Verrucomicrobiae bacterium]